jgi:hypothetical protein
MDVLSWRLRSHRLWFEGSSVMLGCCAVGLQGAVGGSRPLVAASNLAKNLE